MSKGVRQYVGLFSAILAYYLIHEGAHFIYALSIGVFKASMYYITIALLLLDPLYLSVLCGMFGGGDMNGISLLMLKMVSQIGYGVLLVINIVVFFKLVMPKYKLGFEE